MFSEREGTVRLVRLALRRDRILLPGMDLGVRADGGRVGERRAGPVPRHRLAGRRR